MLSINPIDKPNIKNKFATNPLTTLWFNNQFILNYIEEKGMFNSSEDAHMQLLNY